MKHTINNPLVLVYEPEEYTGLKVNKFDFKIGEELVSKEVAEEYLELLKASKIIIESLHIQFEETAYGNEMIKTIDHTLKNAESHE